ncbi:tubulin-tyrosine ligase [Karstenula rhodostoma CBS 690.94]|uniref:Tubulin-tyrosine ligase n=1 Tax=Karstenula rhodostoma CBS 690.94 TaxID=1392251 RepID=A0A9P4PJT6_9PLEO|nr:tubulin-tyrosine ligase [Karstenula rhodostoma CBS 690.94]
MAPKTDDNKIYALINYEDPYVQPLIVAAVKKHFPPDSIEFISALDALPSPSSRLLQWVQYESIDFPYLLSHASTSLANAYVIRKALIRKHYLSTTVANWVVKHPESVLARGVKPSVEFEVDYAEFLDDALVEAWELHESWERGRRDGGREWWILKPGMSERGQGIRLFSSEEELTSIFEGWDPESDDEEEEEEDARSDAGSSFSPTTGKKGGEEEKEGNGIITSQLRHFIAQPYIHPPLLFSNRKFHIRTYVLATAALSVYVYRPMLALFAARPYAAPSSTAFAGEAGDAEDALRAHLTNTCLQETGEREGSVGLFWELPDAIPDQPTFEEGEDGVEVKGLGGKWKDDVFKQLCSITGEVFEAAARGMSIHFQPLPNAFEIFGLDFMVGVEEDGALRTWLLEVNAFPDFRQTGDECKGVVEGLMESVVRVGVVPFFAPDAERDEGDAELVKVLDIDLGRR